MIRPDGTQPAPEGFTGPGESIPWGINVDGNDDVWVGNMWSRSATLLAGDNTEGSSRRHEDRRCHPHFQERQHPDGHRRVDRPGRQRLGREQLEPSRSGRRPESGFPTSTWGGGSGFTVIYGAAAPVKPPRMGKVQTY